MKSIRKMGGAEQKGSVLIEALVAAMIFAIASIGALGLILSSAKASGESRLRVEAALLAQDLVGRISADMGTSLTQVGQYDDAVTGASIPAYKTQWLANVAGALPSSSATVAVDTAATNSSGGLGADVTIRIRWQAAGQDSRTYTLVSSLTPNQ